MNAEPLCGWSGNPAGGATARSKQPTISIPKSSIKDKIYDWSHIYLKNHLTSEKDPKTSTHSWESNGPAKKNKYPDNKNWRTR